MTQSRFTQNALEAIESPVPPSRFTQAAIESVTQPVPPSRFTQGAIEVMVANRPLSRFTQSVIEVLVPNAVALDLGGVTGQLWPRGGEPLPGGGASGPAGGDLDGTYPNPEVAALKGVPMVGTLGAGQVWQKHATNDEMVPLTVAGGSSFTMFDPDKPPADTQYSILMDGTEAAPTQVNLGTSTFDINTTKPRSVVVKGQNAAGWRGLVWPMPAAITAGDFTAWTHVRLRGIGANYFLGGLMLRSHNDQASGRFFSGYIGYISDAGRGHYPSLIEYGAGLSNSGVVVVDAGINTNSMDCIVTLRRVGSTYSAEMSLDGRTISKNSVASSTVGGGSAFSPAYIALVWYRVNVAIEATHSWGPIYMVPSGTEAIGGDRLIALV